MPRIENLLKGVKKDVILADYTTFKIGGRASYFFVAKTKEDLTRAILAAKKFKSPFFILGEGSNILVADKGYNGLVIKMQNAKIKMQNENSKCKIICEAGTLLASVVSAAAKNSFSGLEWAAGIPGTVGGAIRGNAGAFDGEIRNVVSKVEVFDAKSGKIKVLKNKGCKFAYRDSILKKYPNLIVLSAELKLKKGDKQKIKKKIQDYLNYRKERHPQQPSAGSIFKNVNLEKLPLNFFKKFPETKKIIKEKTCPAAYLIAKCSLKGKKAGFAQISEIHPNFIVNFDGGKAKDVFKLINLTKQKVKKRFGIKLEEEIQFLGF